MRPTALGVKAAFFYAALVGAFFAAPYANSFFLLLAFLTVLGVVAMVSGAWYARGLGGELNGIEPAPAGAGPVVILRGARRSMVTVRLRLAGRRAIAEAAGTRGRLEPLPRGIYPIESAHVATTWPLGLVRFRKALRAPSEIVVYPAPAALEETPAGGGGSAGDLLAPDGAQEGLLQPAGLREFRPGDDLRGVHWKASARRNELVLREWEGGRGDGAEVVLDRRCEAARLDQALSILTAAAQLARETKETLTLHSQGLSAMFGATHRPWPELLRFLAGAEALPPSAPAPPPSSPHVARLPR